MRTIAGVVQVTDEDFDAQVLRSAEPVLVEFSAPWCPPCRALEPLVAEVARETAGRLTVCELDVGSQAAVAARFQILVVPTLMLFHRGAVLGRESGLVPRERILELIAQAGVSIATPA